MKLFDYECKTTFWGDFSIADRFGYDAILDTFRRAFQEWRTDAAYLTELVMVLNHKIWYWYERNESIAELYDYLWRIADEYAVNHLTGDDLDYYYRTTD